MSPPVFIISLADSHERRRHAEAQCRDLNLPWEFVDAVDYRHTDRDDIADVYDSDKCRRHNFDFQLAPAEVGCYLSHLKVYQLMRERGVRRAVVAEDDVVLRDASEAGRVIAALGALPEKFDIVQLAAHISRSPRISRYYARPIAENDDLHISRFQGIASGAYFYMIDLDYAEALLDLHRRLKVFLPVDIMLFDMAYAPRFAHTLCVKSNWGSFAVRRLAEHDSGKFGSILSESGRHDSPRRPQNLKWPRRLLKRLNFLRYAENMLRSLRDALIWLYDWRVGGRAWRDSPKMHWFEAPARPPKRNGWVIRRIYASPSRSSPT